MTRGLFAYIIIGVRPFVSQLKDADDPQRRESQKKEGTTVANIKSAKKRILVSQRNADRNKSIRSGVKTAVKKVHAAIEAGDQAAAKQELINASSIIDKACTKGVYHKNTASRKVSRLSKAVNKMA